MSTSPTLTFKGTVIWLVCATYFIYEFFMRTILGTFQDAISHDLHLTPFTFALLSSTAYQLTYGLIQLPVSIITARFGLKKTLFVAALICCSGQLGLSFADSFFTACLCRVFIGFGSAFGFVGLLIAVYDWMPRANIGFFIGLSQFIGTLGPMFAGGPLSSLALTSSLDWRMIFLFVSVIGFVIAGLIFIIVAENNQANESFIKLTRPVPTTDSLYQVLKQPQVWLIALYSGCNYFALGYLSENASRSFLEQKGFSVTSASYMLTVAWMGYAIGCASFGYLSDLIERRRAWMVICAVISIFSLVSIIWLPMSLTLTTLAFFTLGLGTSGQSIGFTTIGEQCRKEHLAIGLGINNSMIILLSAIGAPIMGLLMSHHAAPITLPQYQQALSILLIIAGISWLLAHFCIRETYCKPQRENILLTV